MGGEEVFDLLILLSGPEPQRTILEEMLLAQLCGGAGVATVRTVLVRGLPKGGPALAEALAGAGAAKAPEGLIVYDYLSARELGRVIGQSRLVLARSGYSTVMDLVRMGKNAIYVPTPGQPEQEYLGEYLAKMGLGVSMRQKGFVLKEALVRAGRLEARRPVGGEKEMGDEELAKEVGRVVAMVLAQSAAADLG